MSFQRVKLKRKIFKIAFVLNTPINSEIVLPSWILMQVNISLKQVDNIYPSRDRYSGRPLPPHARGHWPASSFLAMASWPRPPCGTVVLQTIMERQKLDSRELKRLEAIFLLLVLYNVDMSSCQVSYAHLGNSFLGCFCYDNYLAQQNTPRHITTVQKCSAMQPVRRPLPQ